MYTKKIVILAKSAKRSNFCVAGLANTGEWIRPISNIPTLEDAVPRDVITFNDDTELQILDVVEVPLLELPVNNQIQPENFYYDERYSWKKVGHIKISDVIKWRGFDHRQEIFYNFDRDVDTDFILKQSKRESLLLLPVKNLIIRIEEWDYKKFYAHFDYNGRRYRRFSVGDIAVRENFKNYAEGEYLYKKDSIVIFSLTNPYIHTNKCYKMLAQIF